MTAKSHGLEEFAKTLESSLVEDEQYDHERIFKEAEQYIGSQKTKSKALLPCRPVLGLNNPLAQASWPMSNLRAQEAERAAQMFRHKKDDLNDNEDLFFDATNYNSSNKQVADILSKDASSSATAADGSQGPSDKQQNSAVVEATLEDLEGAQWGDDELAIDIDVTEDIVGGIEAPEEGKTDQAHDGQIFVPPA